MATKMKTAETEIQILQMQEGSITCRVVGVTPLIMNRMSEKAKHELLLPKGKKTAADKAANLKHDIYAEFRASAYLDPDPKAPTRLRVMSTAFKGVMRSAALDIPGARKAQIGRLTYVTGEYVSIYGKPKMHMSIVRNSDVNHTPDVRTRLIVPRWAAQISVRYNSTLLKESSVLNLLATGGMFVAIGDWRVEKGSGTFGQFRLAGAKDAEFDEIVKHGGYSAQVKGMAHPEPYDEETAEMKSWFDVEATSRGYKHLEAA